MDADQKKHVEQVQILVNEKDITMEEQKVTGKEIKEAAIRQGVNIQPDFVLSLELSDRRSRVIGDDDPIEVHKGERFLAVAPDDNS